MKLGIMQPYFLPYLGYWQLIKAVDKHVIYDDVNYIKGGWINRNNLLISGEKKLFTLSLSGASSFKLINEIEIGDDFQKLRKTLQTNYARAPYFREIITLFDEMTSCKSRCLSSFIANSIYLINEYLNIKTKMVISSELSIDSKAKGQDRVIDICKYMHADTYINAVGGQDLYDKATFSVKGIELKFIKAKLSPYAQFKNNFVSGLSILDVLMFNSKDTACAMLDDYDLE